MLPYRFRIPVFAGVVVLGAAVLGVHLAVAAVVAGLLLVALDYWWWRRHRNAR